jgi:hypothetical protein
MKKTLLVSGCSITHGAELYNGFVHPENIKLSFSQHLAEKLNCDLLNVALSAASNEYIFHSLMKNILAGKNLHSVIVVWTGTDRLYWKTNNRHYFFLGNFASSMVDLVNFEMHDLHKNNCWFTGDNDEIVEKISNIHNFFVTDYFDHKRDCEKLLHYKFVLESVCKLFNIKLISLEWNDLNVGIWLSEGRHPNKDEHKQIADLIYKNFYENIHL